MPWYWVLLFAGLIPCFTVHRTGPESIYVTARSAAMGFLFGLSLAALSDRSPTTVILLVAHCFGQILHGSGLKDGRFIIRNSTGWLSGTLSGISEQPFGIWALLAATGFIIGRRSPKLYGPAILALSTLKFPFSNPLLSITWALSALGIIANETRLWRGSFPES